MPRASFNRRQRRQIQQNLKRARRRASRAGREGLRAAGYLYSGIVRVTVALPMIGGTPSAHAAALADLDFPYATRHGDEPQLLRSILLPVAGFSRPELRVHSVSGDLRRAIKTRSRLGRGEFTVFVDTNKAPHAMYVAEGTSVMMARDFVVGPAEDPAVIKALRDTIVKVAGEVFRSKK